MRGGGVGGEDFNFGPARVAAGLALFGAVVAILVIDALRTDYQADAVVVTSILGAAAALLGVEVLDVRRRKKDGDK